MVLEKTLESSLDSKEIKPVNPTGNQFWIFTGRTDAAAEVPILWPPDAKSQFIGKYSDAGKDWRKEEGTTEDEMVGWHHQFNGHEFEQTYMLAKQSSKFYKPSFNSMWTVNFQMFKLDLEEAEESQIKLNHRSNWQHLFDHWKSKRVPEKHLHLLYKLWKIPKEIGIPDHLTCLLRNLYAG